ncbi:MAG: beta-ketoacyl-ACP synthase II [Myxococcota bacterium]
MRRVVVTGMGVVCPVGNCVQQAWSALMAGRSGIGTVSRWQERGLAVTVGGEVHNLQPQDFIQPPKDVRRMDRLMHLAMAAAAEAWQQAGLPDKIAPQQAEKAGAIIGVGFVGLDFLLNMQDVLNQQGPQRVSPFLVPAMISNLVPGHLSIRYGLKGGNWSVASACASGNHALGEAFSHIRQGHADVMLAGGAESAMHPLAAAGFCNMKALCTSKNDAPQQASRPFDRERDGFVMGEGAGLLILEEYKHAKKRGAPILAELVGYGFSSDAYHVTAPSPGGQGAQRAMIAALQQAKMDPKDIDYINAHGTSTPYNDATETQAIHAVFGSHASKLQLSSTKSMTGHLLGAAGGVEAVFSVQSLQRGELPPTINYQTPDPECDLDYVPNEGRQCRTQAVMSNSFGFGGSNAVLIFCRAP